MGLKGMGRNWRSSTIGAGLSWKQIPGLLAVFPSLGLGCSLVALPGFWAGNPTRGLAAGLGLVQFC